MAKTTPQACTEFAEVSAISNCFVIPTRYLFVCWIRQPGLFGLKRQPLSATSVRSVITGITDTARFLSLFPFVRSDGDRAGCGMPIAALIVFCINGMWARRMG